VLVATIQDLNRCIRQAACSADGSSYNMGHWINQSSKEWEPCSFEFSVNTWQVHHDHWIHLEKRVQYFEGEAILTYVCWQMPVLYLLICMLVGVRYLVVWWCLCPIVGLVTCMCDYCSYQRETELAMPKWAPLITALQEVSAAIDISYLTSVVCLS
jgi:hypothetical protein